jgi:hypothetical protein
LADGIERRKYARLEVRWPISIISDQGMIEGESRNITPEGVFVHCRERLYENRTYQLIIKLPKHQPIVVKGKLVWSNLDEVEEDSVLGGMGFAFVKISQEDSKYLKKVISVYGKRGALQE